eukprot:g6189.t1
MLYIKASELTSGSAITVESLNKLTSGALMDLSTTTVDGHMEGLVRLTATALTTGVGMKINTNGLTSGKALHISSGTGNSLLSTGILLSLDANTQATFTNDIMGISATAMATGNILKLTGGTGLTSGRLMHLETLATAIGTGAVFDITANKVTSERIVRVSGNLLTSGNMVDLFSSSPNMDADGKIININVTAATSGTIIDMKAPALTLGTMMDISAKALTEGKVIDITDNEDLTTGHLLHIKTISATVANAKPIFIEYNSMNVGTGIKMDVPALSTGHGMVIDSLDVTALENDGSGGYGTGGSLLTLKGTSQTSGTLLDIDATALTTGRAIRVKSGNGVSSGALVDLGTDSTAAGYIDGLVRLTANSMTTGVGMHISSEALTTGHALHITSGSGSSLTTGGSLLLIEANSQDEALVVVDLSATAMKTGTLLKVTNSGSALSSGKLVHLETTETGLTNAVFDITANTVENDRIVRISSNSLTSGAALEIVATGNDATMTGDGRVIDIQAAEQTKGKLLKIDGSALTDGIGLYIKGGALTTGSLLHLHSTSAASQNGIMRIDATLMTTKKVVTVNAPDVTSGTVIDITAAENSNGNIFSGKLINIVAGAQANVGGTIVDISANSLTTGIILDITKHKLQGAGRAIKLSGGFGAEFQADGLAESGKALYIHSNSANSDYKSVVEIDNKNPASTKTQTLHLTHSATSDSNTNLGQKPATALAIDSLLSEAVFIRVSSDTNAENGAQITLSRDRQGSDLTQTATTVVNGDVIGRIHFDAFTSAVRQTVGAIESRVDDSSLSSDALGGKLIFKTSQVGTDATLKRRLTLTNNNQLAVGDNEEFTILKASRKTNGHGVDLPLFGQAARGTDKNGGDIIVRVGSHTGSGLKGEMKVQNGDGSDILTIDEAKTTLETPTIDVSDGVKTVTIIDSQATSFQIGTSNNPDVLKFDTSGTVEKVIVDGNVDVTENLLVTKESNFADDVIILTNILSHNNDDAVELFDKIGINGNPFTNTIKLGGGTGSDSIVNIYQTDIGGGFSSPGATIEDDGDMKTNGILTADSAVKLNYNDNTKNVSLTKSNGKIFYGGTSPMNMHIATNMPSVDLNGDGFCNNCKVIKIGTNAGNSGANIVTAGGIHVVQVHGVTTISSINTAGVYTVANGAVFAKDETVTVSACGGNNGEFLVSSISGNDITLHGATGAITTTADATPTACKISTVTVVSKTGRTFEGMMGMKIETSTTNCLTTACSVPDNGDIEFGPGKHINGNILNLDSQNESDDHSIFTGVTGNFDVNIGTDSCIINVTGDLQIGGGYSSTGTTFATNGDGSLNGILTVDGTSTLTGSVTFGGNIISDANEDKTIFDTITSQTITIGDVTSSNTYINLNAIKIGGEGVGYTGSTTGNTGATIEKSGNFFTDGNIIVKSNVDLDGSANFDVGGNILRNTQSDSEIFTAVTNVNHDITILPTNSTKQVSMPFKLQTITQTGGGTAHVEFTSSGVQTEKKLHVDVPLFYNTEFDGTDDSSHPSANALDGNYANKWITTSCNSCGLIMTGLTTDSVVTSVRVKCVTVSDNKWPTSLAIYGSGDTIVPNDGGTWTPIGGGDITIPDFTSNDQVQTVIFSNSNVYKHYKIVFKTIKLGTTMEIREIALLTNVGDFNEDVILNGNIRASTLKTINGNAVNTKTFDRHLNFANTQIKISGTGGVKVDNLHVHANGDESNPTKIESDGTFTLATDGSFQVGTSPPTAGTSGDLAYDNGKHISGNPPGTNVIATLQTTGASGRDRQIFVTTTSQAIDIGAISSGSNTVKTQAFSVQNGATTILNNGVVTSSGTLTVNNDVTIGTQGAPKSITINNGHIKALSNSQITGGLFTNSGTNNIAIGNIDGKVKFQHDFKVGDTNNDGTTDAFTAVFNTEYTLTATGDCTIKGSNSGGATIIAKSSTVGTAKEIFRNVANTNIEIGKSGSANSIVEMGNINLVSAMEVKAGTIVFKKHFDFTLAAGSDGQIKYFVYTTGVVTITDITTNGVYTVIDGTGDVDKFAVGDMVTVAGCTAAGNNGDFKIKTKGTDTLELVTSLDAAITTTAVTSGTGGCTISKRYIDITNNDGSTWLARLSHEFKICKLMYVTDKWVKIKPRQVLYFLQIEHQNIDYNVVKSGTSTNFGDNTLVPPLSDYTFDVLLPASSKTDTRYTGGTDVFIFNIKFKSKVKNDFLYAKVTSPSGGKFTDKQVVSDSDTTTTLSSDEGNNRLVIKPGDYADNIVQIFHSIDGTFSIRIRKPCAKGFYFDSNECIICAAGKYSTTEPFQTSTCINCPAGTFNNNYGSYAPYHDSTSDCTTCYSGQYQPYTGYAYCFNCPAGSYRTTDSTNDNKAWNGNNRLYMDSISDCTRCGAGKYSEANGQTSESTCTDCPVGTFNNQPSNYYWHYTGHDSTSDCTTDCPAGRYGVNNANNVVEHDQLSDCAICGAGKYSEAVGAQTSATCSDCPAGTVGVNNDNVVGDHDQKADCTTCNSGEYQDGTGQTSCKDCPAGRYRTTDSTNDNKNWNGNANGNNDGMNALADCTICAAGSKTDTGTADGATSCTACVAGKFSATSTVASCSDCAAGTYNDLNIGIVTCKTCAPGSKTDTGTADGATSCTACVAGKFSATSTVASCSDCAAGTYNDLNIGIATCKTCTATESNKYVSTACTTTVNTVFSDCGTCNAGQYISTACAAGDATTVGSATSCSDCTASQTNKYVSTACTTTANTVFSDCGNCDANEYVSTACAAGSATTVGSATVCTACASNEHSSASTNHGSATTQCLPN